MHHFAPSPEGSRPGVGYFPPRRGAAACAVFKMVRQCRTWKMALLGSGFFVISALCLLLRPQKKGWRRGAGSLAAQESGILGLGVSPEVERLRQIARLPFGKRADFLDAGARGKFRPSGVFFASARRGRFVARFRARAILGCGRRKNRRKPEIHLAPLLWWWRSPFFLSAADLRFL